MWYDGSIPDEEGELARTRSRSFAEYRDEYMTAENVLERDARRLMEEFPYGTWSPDVYNEPPEVWGVESFVAMRDVAFNKTELQERAYTCGEEEEPEMFNPSDEYIIAGHQKSKERVVLAGYRLEHSIGRMLAQLDVPSMVAYYEQTKTKYAEELCTGAY
eukprot:Trichotokara_eunicae@DN2441_c0_g1_i3.p1